MPPRSNSPERDSAAMFAEAESHGGLVALEGGSGAGRWYWRDWYLQQPADCWRRVGYRETSERRENPDPKLRGYGTAVVWRFDLALVPAVVEVEERAPSLQPVVLCRECGGRLLLIRPGRVLCEACRIALGLPREVPDAA